MKRIFSDYAYGTGPRAGCWWDETCDLPEMPRLETDISCDVAIIGGGFTGLSAALHLAQAGIDVVVLEVRHIGWGASGRNGGFCCLGGSKAEDATLDRRFGREGRLEYRQAEKHAVALVEQIIAAHGLDVDRHSRGETELAHRPKDMAGLEAAARTVEENYGIQGEMILKADLADHGLAGPFHGALTTPIGFGLNPRKYLAGLARAARDAGARIFESAGVRRIKRAGRLTLDAGHKVAADRVVVATNGYSSEDVPAWLAGRYMPTQSTVLVTRPISQSERESAGWTSDQMAFDTRNLLHYFRNLPDGRFLFGMRGGLGASPRAEARARRRIRRDFEAMFPAWAHVETPHAWSGMVCLARSLLPFVGEIPGQRDIFAGLCYHGNGVAMGTYSGALLARLILGTGEVPLAMRPPLGRFPLGGARRALMLPVYAGLMLGDM